MTGSSTLTAAAVRGSQDAVHGTAPAVMGSSEARASAVMPLSRPAQAARDWDGKYSDHDDASTPAPLPNAGTTPMTQAGRRVAWSDNAAAAPSTAKTATGLGTAAPVQAEHRAAIGEGLYGPDMARAVEAALAQQQAQFEVGARIMTPLYDWALQTESERVLIGCTDEKSACP